MHPHAHLHRRVGIAPGAGDGVDGEIEGEGRAHHGIDAGIGVEDELICRQHAPLHAVLVAGRDHRLGLARHVPRALMPDRLERAAIDVFSALEEIRRPHPGVAGVVRGHPVEAVVVGREADIVKFDADVVSAWLDGVDLVVDSLLGAPQCEAARPVESNGPFGEHG